MRIMLASVALICLSGRASAQVTDSVLAGHWRACFSLDSASADGQSAVCGNAVLPVVSCGIPTIAIDVPLEALADTLRYSGGNVRYQVSYGADTTIAFGGRVDPPETDGEWKGCAIYGDDASLIAAGVYRHGAIRGTWGIGGFIGTGDIGTFLMRRDD